MYDMYETLLFLDNQKEIPTRHFNYHSSWVNILNSEYTEWKKPFPLCKAIETTKFRLYGLFRWDWLGLWCNF